MLQDCDHPVLNSWGGATQHHLRARGHERGAGGRDAAQLRARRAPRGGGMGLRPTRGGPRDGALRAAATRSARGGAVSHRGA